MGQGLGPTRPEVAVTFGPGPGFGPGSNDINQILYGACRAFSGHYFFASKILLVVMLMLRL
jgi:hypothetical protein